MEIPGVPDKVSRETVTNFLRDLGLDPSNLTSFRMDHKGIYVEVFALDADGKKIVNLDEVAKHNIFIEFIW